MSRRDAFYVKLTKDVQWTFWSICMAAALFWLEALYRLVSGASDRPSANELWAPPAFALAAYCLKSVIELVIIWTRRLDNKVR